MRPSYSPTNRDREPAWQGQKILDVNLVLEGGAMRAQFTAGVLDFFMDNGVWCKTVLGTSASIFSPQQIMGTPELWTMPTRLPQWRQM